MTRSMSSPLASARNSEIGHGSASSGIADCLPAAQRAKRQLGPDARCHPSNSTPSRPQISAPGQSGGDGSPTRNTTPATGSHVTRPTMAGPPWPSATTNPDSLVRGGARRLVRHVFG
jgi:hypothetical protein